MYIQVCFENHIVINGRSNGLKMCKFMDMKTNKVKHLKLEEECTMYVLFFILSFFF